MSSQVRRWSERAGGWVKDLEVGCGVELLGTYVLKLYWGIIEGFLSGLGT